MKTLLSDYQPATVHEEGWGSLEDGPLLAAAQQEFDVLITLDRNLEFLQNLAKFHIGLVVVRVPKNQLRYFQAVKEKLIIAAEQVRPGEVIHVE